MKGCDNLVEVGRRHFLRGGAAAAAAGVAVMATNQAQAAKPKVPGARVDYPSNRLGNISDLKINDPIDVTYPDDEASGVLLKLGKAVEGGVGPDGDIVGFSTLCPHKGFGLNYDTADRSFNCPGHYSRFDAEAGGQQIHGQATQNLPQYNLRIDEKGDIYAEGVDELIFGRMSNVL